MQAADLQKGHIHWIAIAQAVAIVMVLMYHVRLLNATTGENYLFIDQICGFVGHVHMPTFFFVSGFLLYYSRISQSVKLRALYKDKALRLLLPFAFCTVLGNVAQLVFNGFVKHPHDVTPGSFVQSFFFAEGYPWPHRWFLMALILMMVCYPLYRYVVDGKTRIWLFLLLLMAIRHVLCNVDVNVFSFRQFVYYLPFFFLGIISCKYRLWQYLAHWSLPFVLWALALALYIIPCAWSAVQYCMFAYELLCVSALVATALQLSRCRPMLFSSFRGYVYQIYIFGVAFQAFVELILWRRLGCPDSLVLLFYVANVLAGLLLPLLVCKVAEKIPSRMLHLCLGLRA
ncbi:MAG: acyltransferase [Bacteroidaceae bacterium]|nr:acyltransferase [Bacteroidaceae bacterium]